MGRSPCCSKYEESLNYRGAWTASEDKILREYIKNHGEGRWKSLAKRAGLKRCGKSCRLRWLNYLRPDIKRGNISPEEDELLVRLHRLLGNRWSLIAGRLPRRTDNEIKNYWNTELSKRVQMGEFDPKFQKINKRRDIPSSSKKGVLDKDNYTAQSVPLKTKAVRYSGRALADIDSLPLKTKAVRYSGRELADIDNLPLKTKAVRYSGRAVADIDNVDRYEYDHVQNSHDHVINQEEGLKAVDQAVEIDTSKSWCQLLLEDCMEDYQHDRIEAIHGLQPNSIINASNGSTDEHHQFLPPSFSQSIILQENSSSSYCNLIDQEFSHSKDFNSSDFDNFLDLGELSILLP